MLYDKITVLDELQADDSCRLLEQDDEQGRSVRRSGKILQCRSIVLLGILLCLLAALVSVASSRIWIWRNTNSICFAHTSRGSPITEAVNIKYDIVQFNGSLLKENVYRLPASPEVDAAWEALGVDYRSVIVPEGTAPRVGLASDQVKVNHKYGGGFLANVEGLHQLHCLNLVRKSLYYNYQYYYQEGKGAFMNNDYVLRKHISHCLDIIRQQLMCTVDIGVLGQVWFQPAHSQYPEAYVDFNTKHMCRDFGVVRAWAKDNQIPESVPEDFLEPPKEGDRIFTVIP